MVHIGFFDDAWCTRWRDRLAADAELAHTGRWCDVAVAITAGTDDRLFRFAAARLVTVTDGAAPPAGAVVLRGSAESWREFLRPVPPPHHTDLLGMSRRRADFTIEGLPVLIRHLRALDRVFALARTVGDG